MSEELLYWQALNRALDAEMAADASVFTLGEDVGLYGGSYRVTEGLCAKYGEWRVRDTPISENSFTGLGVGAALVGLRPVVEIMTINFMLLALDSIINAAAKIPFMSGGQFGMPLVVRVPGGVAHQLGAQHSQRLEYTLMNVPGLRIAVPSTPQDAYWQLRQAIVSDEPIILLEHELLYFSKGPVDVLADAPPMHRAVVRREGHDLTIVSYSRHAVLSQQAADELSKEGIEAEVIDLRSLKPIDWDTCATSLEKTHRMLVVEEDCRFAGAGAEIVATLTERCFDSLDAPVQRLAGLDMSTPFNGALEAATIPQVPDIVAAARALCRPTQASTAGTKSAPSPTSTRPGAVVSGVAQATPAPPKIAPPKTAGAPQAAAAAAGKGEPAAAATSAAASVKTTDAERTHPSAPRKGQRREPRS
jgi:pyruvate dehydrogenase E1 component beta subunit